MSARRPRDPTARSVHRSRCTTGPSATATPRSEAILPSRSRTAVSSSSPRCRQQAGGGAIHQRAGAQTGQRGEQQGDRTTGRAAAGQAQRERGGGGESQNLGDPAGRRQQHEREQRHGQQPSQRQRRHGTGGQQAVGEHGARGQPGVGGETGRRGQPESGPDEQADRGQQPGFVEANTIPWALVAPAAARRARSAARSRRSA